MVGLALRQAMREMGEAAYGPMLELAKSGSSLEKGAAAGALASTRDEGVYQKLLSDVILSEDSPLTGRQSGTVLNGLLGSDTFGEQTWDWFKDNLPTYVKKVPDVRKGGLPGAGGNFCSLDRRNEVRDFVEANADLMPGYERSLLQTLESIELCAALKDAKANDLATALKAR
jgi:alanyl aminopeptidase